MRALSRNLYLNYVLCIALLFKAMMPAGFMPDLEALRRGAFTIVICSGFASKTMTVNGNFQPVDDHTSKSFAKQDAQCSFAGLNQSIIPVLATLVIAVALTLQRLSHALADDQSRSVSLTEAWPRAPPAL